MNKLANEKNAVIDMPTDTFVQKNRRPDLKTEFLIIKNDNLRANFVICTAIRTLKFYGTLLQWVLMKSFLMIDTQKYLLSCG